MEGAQSNDETPSYDSESLSSRATTAETAVLSDGENHRRHAGPSPSGSSSDESDSGSTLTQRRGSNPESLSGDEPERRQEWPQPTFRLPRPTKDWFDFEQIIRREETPPNLRPIRSIWDLDRHDWCTLAIIGVGSAIVLWMMCFWTYNHYIRDRHVHK